MLPGGRAGPQQQREERRRETGGERHVRGGHSGVSQHRRHQGEQGCGQRRCGTAEIPPRPQPHHEGRRHKKWQDAEAHARQHLRGMTVAIHHGDALLILILDSQRPRARKIRSEGGHHARQRRMLRFIAIHVLREVLQAARHVARLVPGGTDFRIGGDDAQAGEGNQSDGDEQRAARQKRNQGGVPECGRRRTGRLRGGAQRRFRLFLRHAWSFLAVEAARRQIHEVDRAHALLHRKVGIPGPQVGIAVFQAVLRGVILCGTDRGPTFGGLQRMDVLDRAAGPGRSRGTCCRRS